MFGCLGSCQAPAQTAPTRFDVAVIKPSPADDNNFSFRSLRGGGLSASGVTVKMLIMEAYGVKAFQVSGGPSWIASDRWDIEARVEGVSRALRQEEHGMMIRSLLEDRFQFSARREVKEMPIFELVVDRGGPQLTLHTGEPPPPGQMIRLGRGSLRVQKGRIALLTGQLERQVSRPVIDKTDLKGEYDFVLEWTPEPGEGGPESIGLPPDPTSVSPTRVGPSIFTALQEQLGLRLRSARGPGEVIVVDRVSRPSPN